MPDLEGTTPEVTPEEPKGGTGGPSAGSSVVDGKNINEWVKSYKGLQTSYLSLQTKLNNEIADLNAKLEAANAKIEELGLGTKGKETEMTALQARLAAQSQELATLKSDHSALESTVARKNLVMSEFPELASFEAKGLLPTAEDEEKMKAAFGTFRETLAATAGASVADFISGASPAAKREVKDQAKTGVEDRQYLLDQMIATAGRDPKAYQEWQRKLDEFDVAHQG